MEALIAMAESIAPLLLAEGVSCADAERVLRSVCIHEAARAEAAKGNRTNVSRLALLTGVDRHVVARYLRIAPKPDPTKLQTHRHRLNRILAQWHSDPDYSEAGRPRALEIEAGQRRKSFWSLSKTYAKDAYPPLILSELVKVSAVQRMRDGRVRPLTRTYKAMELDEEAVHEIGRRVRDLTRTLVHNMAHEAEPRICASVQSIEIDEEQLALLRRAVQERSNTMLATMEQVLKSSRWQRTGTSGRRVRVAWTCYVSEETLNENQVSRRERSPVRRKPPRAPARAAARKVGRKAGW
jgi:hypothetical protein